MDERLQKILAHAGFGSRRACEEMIIAGRVTVNGEIAHIGSKADIEKDQIKLDGKLIRVLEPNQYIMLNKPKGVLSTVTSPDPRPTVRELVPVKGTLYPVGRLDVDSEGLILLTNDGELANQLTHPRYGHEKEYRVFVSRQPDEKQLSAWRHGVVLKDGYRTESVQVDLESHSGAGTWLRVTMKEGRKRQIRETCRQIGLTALNIIRIRIGPLRLGNLKPKEWRFLTSFEVKSLQSISSTKSPSKTRRSKKQ